MLDMSKAYKEINEILKYIPKEYIERIPPQLLKVIKENMDENYEYKVSHIKDFENQEMLNETRVLLAVIYRDYFASEEEREKIKEEEREFFEREDNSLEKVLNKRNNNLKSNLEEEQQQEKITKESTQLTKYEEKKWYQKIIEFIKRIRK